jgi:hypothetical protein
MRTRFVALALPLAFLAACSDGGSAAGNNLAGNGGGSRNTPTTSAGALIVDHRAVQGFDSIPRQWLAAAKALTLHYAHTSHGFQVIEGLAALEERDPEAYSVAVRESGDEGLPPEEDPPALRIYDGNPPETYITPDLYWESDGGRSSARDVAGTGRYDFSMWAWCSQQSDNADADVQAYLETMDGFEAAFPSMRFILMTGHTEQDPDKRETLNHNNDLVRQYAGEHGKVLFDFADIESWDPDGTEHPDTDDSCPWCGEWCAAHPESPDCTAISEEIGDGCQHSRGLNCVMKAKAFWWMMARLAGWDGN